MRKINRILLPLAMAAVAIGASAQSNVRPAGPNLTVGSNAPSLEVAKWVKGTPVDNLDRGKVYVVEFWATWCGPCKISIPHLTELHKKFGDAATFIGVSSFENNWSLVAPFVSSEGDKMNYDVAMDKVDKPTDREGFMAKNWMEAANQNGIPTAFIVDREGKIAWIGHPMNLEEPLGKVIAGTWDRDAAAKQFAEQSDQEAKQAEASQKANAPLVKVERQYMADLKAKNYNDALSDLDRLAAVNGTGEQIADSQRPLVYVAKGDSAAYSAWAEKEMGKLSGMPTAQAAMTLNQIAWNEVDPKGTLRPRDLKLALKAATRAVELSQRKEAAMLDTLAWCYYSKGDKTKAISIEKEAMSKISSTDNKADYDMSMNAFKK